MNMHVRERDRRVKRGAGRQETGWHLTSLLAKVPPSVALCKRSGSGQWKQSFQSRRKIKGKLCRNRLLSAARLQPPLLPLLLSSARILIPSSKANID